MAQIRIADSEVAFECAEGDTLIRAGLRAGLGMPYECNVGSCGTCKLEMVAGDVTSAWPGAPALNERDRGKNRVLGCQSHPRGDCTVKVKLADQYLPKVRPRRFRAALSARKEVTHDIGEFHFRPESAQAFLAGQYALFSLPGVPVQRAYSMSNLAGEGVWQFLIKRVHAGQGTGFLFDLQVGETVELDGPYGSAWLREDGVRDLVCIAGGSGISPMLAIARGFAAAETLRERKLHFFFGGRGPRDICGESELRALAPFGERLFFHPSISMRELDTAASWTGAVGFVHEQVPATLAGPLPGYDFYFAGPPPMTQATQRLLMQAKVPFSQMHFDQFY